MRLRVYKIIWCALAYFLKNKGLVLWKMLPGSVGCFKTTVNLSSERTGKNHNMLLLLTLIILSKPLNQAYFKALKK